MITYIGDVLDLEIREWDPEEDMEFFEHCEYEAYKGTVENVDELTEYEIRKKYEDFLEDDELDVTEPEHSVFIAEDDGKKVGLLWVCHRQPFWRFDEPLTWIYNLYVVPEYRRQGLGKTFIDKAEGFTEKEGLKKIALHVIEWNTAARKLYESSGYELIHSHNESRFYEKTIE